MPVPALTGILVGFNSTASVEVHFFIVAEFRCRGRGHGTTILESQRDVHQTTDKDLPFMPIFWLRVNPIFFTSAKITPKTP